MNEYLRSFIIGSSWPVFILYFSSVLNFPNNIKNYSYEQYTLIAPLFLGLLNVFGHMLANKFKLNRLTRFILTGLIGAISVAIFITLFKMYNYSTMNVWMQHYVGLIVIYIYVYVFIVNCLDYLISP